MTTLRPGQLVDDEPCQPPREVGRRAGTMAAQGVTNGDFGELVTANQAMVWRYLRLLGADAHEADDLMQDTFVCLHDAIDRGEPPHTPWAYLRGVARNLLLGARRKRRESTPDAAWCDAVDHFASRPQALHDDRVEALRRCIDGLAGRSRQVVEWHHLQGLSYAEAAARLGLTEHGIKSMLARARQALRECIDRHQQRENRS